MGVPRPARGSGGSYNMSIFRKVAPCGQSVPFRINVCKYCGEHFPSQVTSYACGTCKDKKHSEPKQEWTLEDIMEREG
jgi:hypothetical protein